MKSPPWRYSNPTWTHSCDTCSRSPCLGMGVGLDHLQRSLPTPTVLSFCDYLVLTCTGDINICFSCHPISSTQEAFKFLFLSQTTHRLFSPCDTRKSCFTARFPLSSHCHLFGFQPPHLLFECNNPKTL